MAVSQRAGLLIYRAVEKRGGKVNDDLSMMIRNEHVVLRITEGREQTPHVLTKDELKQVEKYEQEKKKYHYAYEPKFRKYDYVPTGKLRVAAYGEGFIRDSSTAGIEERIGEILLALYLQSEKAKADWYDPTVAATAPLFGKRNHSTDPNSKMPTKKSSYFY